MKRISQVALVLLVIATASQTAFAQRGRGGRGGGGMLFLAGQKSVQEELKLSDDQVKQVEAAAQKQREDMANLSQEERRQKFAELSQAGDKVVGGILNADQLKRLKQINLQRQGAGAFGEADVIQALSLSNEQQEKIKAIQEDAQKESRELFQGGGQGGFSDENRKKFEAIGKAAEEKVHGLLTAEQKTKWSELVGAPFKGEINFGQRRRGGQ